MTEGLPPSPRGPPGPASSLVGVWARRVGTVVAPVSAAGGVAAALAMSAPGPLFAGFGVAIAAFVAGQAVDLLTMVAPHEEHPIGQGNLRAWSRTSKLWRDFANAHDLAFECAEHAPMRRALPAVTGLVEGVAVELALRARNDEAFLEGAGAYDAASLRIRVERAHPSPLSLEVGATRGVDRLRALMTAPDLSLEGNRAVHTTTPDEARALLADDAARAALVEVARDATVHVGPHEVVVRCEGELQPADVWPLVPRVVELARYRPGAAVDAPYR